MSLRRQKSESVAFSTRSNLQHVLEVGMRNRMEAGIEAKAPSSFATVGAGPPTPESIEAAAFYRKKYVYWYDVKNDALRLQFMAALKSALSNEAWTKRNLSGVPPIDIKIDTGNLLHLSVNVKDNVLTVSMTTSYSAIGQPDTFVSKAPNTLPSGMKYKELFEQMSDLITALLVDMKATAVRFEA